MKKLLNIFLFLLIGNLAMAQTWPLTPPWNKVTGKNLYIDSFANPKFKNNFTEDSVLSTDIYGRFKNKRMFGDSANITNIYNQFDSITIINNYLTGIDSTTTKLLAGSEINDSGFVFHNTALTYLILGVKYTALQQDLTLSASDSVYDRYVTVVVDETGYVYAIYGVASSAADLPQIPVDVCPIVTYFIPHLSTTPQGIQNITVYRENIEWVLSGNVTGLNGNYLINPYAGLKSTYIPALINGQYFDYTDASTHVASSIAYLSFYIRLGQAFKNSNRLSVSLQNSGSAVSTVLTIANGSFGFNSALINQYQLVAIPFSAVNFLTQNFNQVHFIVTGNLATGFQVDNVTLQAGNGITTGGSVVTSFNNRNGAVMPKRVDYTWYHDSMSISSDGKKIINWNNGVPLGDSTQYTNGPDTTMYDARGFQVVQKAFSGSPYDSVKLLLAAGTGMEIVDSAIIVNGITLYYKVFRSTGGGGGGGITTAQLTDSLNARALLYGTVTNVAALTLGTTGTDLSSSVANSTTTPVITLNVPTASASNRGALSAADWILFNAKQPPGNYITALTGDGTAVGPGSSALTLATVNSNVGTFGSASKTITHTVNGKGLTTAESEQNIQIAESQVTNLTTDLAAKLNYTDTSFLHGKVIASVAKNTTRDSIIITLNDGTRYAVKDSIGTAGGSSFTRQVITSGTTATVTGGNYIVTIDPPSTIAVFALTTAASPSDMDILQVDFGGTLRSGLVVTAFTVSPNTGQSILDNTPPGSATTDNSLFYRYRTSNTTWYRFKP